jgi:hypothetical protein
VGNLYEKSLFFSSFFSKVASPSSLSLQLKTLHCLWGYHEEGEEKSFGSQHAENEKEEEKKKKKRKIKKKKKQGSHRSPFQSQDDLPKFKFSTASHASLKQNNSFFRN